MNRTAQAKWAASDARQHLRLGVEALVRAALLSEGLHPLAAAHATGIAEAVVAAVDQLIGGAIQVEAGEVEVTDHRE
jgi:hypothetical protein